ncbi:MAG: DUF5996 family protein [Chloroflexi bacterium]|nr:DUF5996 family protein [Chloroflexota bacterium]MCY4247890.1 DUF5996 family protein [Chloroflexota bacterium]
MLTMPLPALRNWDDTRAALHQVALVLSAVRVAAGDKLPNDRQFSLHVTRSGFSTGELPIGAALSFDCSALQLLCAGESQHAFTLDLRGETPQSLLRALQDKLSRGGASIAPSAKQLAAELALTIAPQQANDYIRILNGFAAVLASVREQLGGSATPVVLWAHHFDLGFAWFPGGGADERRDAHVACGFAPSSPGLPRPYLYAYAWSQPTGYLQLTLAPPASATTAGYTGLYLAYDDLRELEEPSRQSESILLEYARNAAALLA